MVDLVKVEQNYLDLFVNKYNINPTARKLGRLVKFLLLLKNF